jgi:3-isopropylmalate/(R)-2-methylmalate dehydratase small subunit
MEITTEYPEIVRVAGRCVAIRGDDIDTDQIMPSRFLRTVSFHGLGAHVFADVRLQAKTCGGLHPLDDPRYEGSRLMAVNRNFGCGSSREHAPQGLYRSGVRAIVGTSFGEIFAGNCVSIGIPCVTMNGSAIKDLQERIESSPETTAILDLISLTLSLDDFVYPVTMSEGRRRLFVEGRWDPVAVLLSADKIIDARMRDLGYIAL